MSRRHNRNGGSKSNSASAPSANTSSHKSSKPQKASDEQTPFPNGAAGDTENNVPSATKLTSNTTGIEGAVANGNPCTSQGPSLTTPNDSIYDTTGTPTDSGTTMPALDIVNDGASAPAPDTPTGGDESNSNGGSSLTNGHSSPPLSPSGNLTKENRPTSINGQAPILTNGASNSASPKEEQATTITPSFPHPALSPAPTPPHSSLSTPSVLSPARCLSPAISPRPQSPMRHPRTRTISSSSATSASGTGEVSVPMYFSGKGVLVTGATGFIGKVLLEKLLRCCPDLACVYCLIRPKNKQPIYKRLEEITSSRLFDRLRSERPGFESQLRPVFGDILLPGLGISDEDRTMLEKNVNVVFHSAATIRFDEPLRVAVEMNVVAVRKMLQLCRGLQHLEALVHVSTAYANCDRPYIEETVYPPPVEPQKIIDVLEWMDDEMLELFTPKLMGEKPNTYTYTKQLAEHMILTEGADLPIAIVRPSIVGAAWKEPFPGWIDNYNGPSGIYIAAGRGILRSMKGDSTAVADIVPVDIPVNIMITVAWYTAVARPRNTLIYHATTGGCNPFTWGDISGIVNKSYNQNPLEGCFRRPNVAIVHNNFLHDYWTCVSHLFPAYVCDVAFRLVGKKPRMVKLYNRLHRSIDCLKFFTCNEWQWSNSNHDMLKHQLLPADLKMFYFDPVPLHWPTYIENYCLGAKKYVLNEDESGLPAARAHIRKLRIIRYVFNSTIAVVLWRVLIAKSQFARNLWFFIVGLVYKFVQFFRITSTMQRK